MTSVAAILPGFLAPGRATAAADLPGVAPPPPAEGPVAPAGFYVVGCGRIRIEVWPADVWDRLPEADVTGGPETGPGGQTLGSQAGE